MRKVMKFFKICRNWLVASAIFSVHVNIIVFIVLFMALILCSMIAGKVEIERIFKFSLSISTSIAIMSIGIVMVSRLLDVITDDNSTRKDDFTKKVDEAETVKEVIILCFRPK